MNLSRVPLLSTGIIKVKVQKLKIACFSATFVFQGLLERSWLVGVLSLEIVVSYVLSQVSISWLSLS